jgi:hypothetical protein
MTNDQAGRRSHLEARLHENGEDVGRQPRGPGKVRMMFRVMKTALFKIQMGYISPGQLRRPTMYVFLTAHTLL